MAPLIPPKLLVRPINLADHKPPYAQNPLHRHTNSESATLPTAPAITSALLPLSYSCEKIISITRRCASRFSWIRAWE